MEKKNMNLNILKKKKNSFKHKNEILLPRISLIEMKFHLELTSIEKIFFYNTIYKLGYLKIK